MMPVAHGLGDDRRGADRRFPGITIDDGAGGAGHRLRQLVAVDERVRRHERKARQRALHSEHRRAEDVVAVDLVDLDRDDRKCERTASDQHGEPIALVLAEHLGIGEADDGLAWIEDHRGDDDGSGERSAAGFVDTRKHVFAGGAVARRALA